MYTNMRCSCSSVFDVKHWLEKRGKVPLAASDEIAMAAALDTSVVAVIIYTLPGV
jgi:hypothetical protein